MPLIVMLILICVIAIIFVVGAQFESQPEIAEINKDIETKEEQISAAVDIAATDIGTNTKATFTVATGEIHIYNSSTSGTATMNKTKWYSFLKQIVDADDNLNAVRSITFDNEVNAPTDSSRLFYPIISNNNHSLSKLVTINNLNKLNARNIENMNSMFEKCSSLTTLDVGKFTVSGVYKMQRTFADCSSLTSVGIFNYAYNVQDTSYMFYNCSSLIEFEMKGMGAHLQYMDSMFSGCTKLRKFVAPTSIPLYDGSSRGDRMFYRCESLEEIHWVNFPAYYSNEVFEGCTSLKKVVLGSNHQALNAASVFKGVTSLEYVDLSLVRTVKYR